MLVHIACGMNAQTVNIPSGVTTPLTATVATATLTATYTPPAGNLNFTRTFAPMYTISDPTSAVFSLNPGSVFGYIIKAGYNLH